MIGRNLFEEDAATSIQKQMRLAGAFDSTTKLGGVVEAITRLNNIADPSAKIRKALEPFTLPDYTKYFQTPNFLIDAAQMFRQSGQMSNTIYQFTQAMPAWKQLMLPSNVEDILSKTMVYQDSIVNSFKMMEQFVPNLNRFSSPVLHSFERAVVSAISKALIYKDWDEVEDIENKSAQVAQALQQSTADTRLDVIESLLQEMKAEMKSLTTKGVKVRQTPIEVYLFYIGILFVFLGGYNDINGIFDISNKEVVEEVKEFQKKQLDVFQKNLASHFTQRRYARANVKLHQNHQTKSLTLAIVKKDQVVIVMNQNHKWLCISYQDNETGEPKAGWVLKKYFLIEK